VARKVSSLEEQLDRLAELRGQPSSPEGCAEAARCLASKMNLVASKAARIAGEWLAAELTPELVAAFDRFMVKPETTDKRCAAKIEILKALCKLEYPSPSVFRRGMQHVQMEPTWGGSMDTAAEVRALGAMGLAQTDDPEALEEIVPLLLDRERDARIGAVRAIAASGLPGGALLLRLKALSGDEPEVLGECFAACCAPRPTKSLEFVAKFLDSHREEAIAEAAALALGDSRLESAFAVLRDAFQLLRAPRCRRTLLLAIALLRRENAIDYLLDLVQNGESQTRPTRWPRSPCTKRIRTCRRGSTARARRGIDIVDSLSERRGRMHFIAWLVLGLVAGFIGSKVVNKSGEGLIMDILLGIVGLRGGLFRTFGGHGVTGLETL
jgi:HEAT repeat protein